MSGIGLVEIMVALTVLGILAAVAAPSLADMLERRRVQAIAEQISSDIAFARAETALRPQSLIIWFQNSSSMSCYTLSYPGSGGTCECAVRLENACSGEYTDFKTTRVPASVGVQFAPVNPSALYTRLALQGPQQTLTANAGNISNGNFSIAVTGRRGTRLQIQVNAMGRAKICSPDGNMSGVPACA